MKHSRWKDILAAVSIVFLLPYVGTVLISGFSKPSAEPMEDSGQRIRLEEDGKVRELDREQYLIEVLAMQMPVMYEPEALKAQAVIARTFFERHGLNGTTVKKQEAVQEYMSTAQMQELWKEKFSDYYKKLDNAVQQTAGERITCNGEPIEPSFHAVSAGMTRNGEEVLGENTYPYLKSRASEKDQNAPEYLTVLNFDEKKLNSIIEKNYGKEAVSHVAASPAAAFAVVERDSAGYVKWINVNGQQVGGEHFRTQFSLPSSCFETESIEKGLRIVCKGLGHGLGMSLYGANELAKEGKTYREILAYYFENIKIVSE